MDDSHPTVFVVDDDQAMRESMAALTETVGLNVRTYGDGQAFLNSYDPNVPGCLVLDVRMPEMNGLDVRKTLTARGYSIPTVFVTGHGDIQMAVEAMRAGAVDFIEKPFRAQALLDSIHVAIALDDRVRREQAERAQIDEKLQTLTEREREIMDLLVEGRSNKTIAYELGIAAKTVDFHRANILDKMGALSVVELVLLLSKLAVD